MTDSKLDKLQSEVTRLFNEYTSLMASGAPKATVSKAYNDYMRASVKLHNAAKRQGQ